MDPVSLQPLIFSLCSQLQSSCSLPAHATVSPRVCATQHSPSDLCEPHPHNKLLDPHPIEETSSLVSCPACSRCFSSPKFQILLPRISRTTMVCSAPPPCAVVGKSTQAECQGEYEIHLMCFLSFSQPVVQCLKTSALSVCPGLSLRKMGGQIQCSNSITHLMM